MSMRSTIAALVALVVVSVSAEADQCEALKVQNDKYTGELSYLLSQSMTLGNKCSSGEPGACDDLRVVEQKSKDIAARAVKAESALSECRQVVEQELQRKNAERMQLEVAREEALPSVFGIRIGGRVRLPYCGDFADKIAVTAEYGVNVSPSLTCWHFPEATRGLGKGLPDRAYWEESSISKARSIAVWFSSSESPDWLAAINGPEFSYAVTWGRIDHRKWTFPVVLLGLKDGVVQSVEFRPKEFRVGMAALEKRFGKPIEVSESPVQSMTGKKAIAQAVRWRTDKLDVLLECNVPTIGWCSASVVPSGSHEAEEIRMREAERQRINRSIESGRKL